MTAREALRLGTRGGARGARPRRHRLARAGQARRPRRLAHRRARARRRRRPRRRPRLRGAAPRRPAARRRRGGRPRRARSSAPTRQEIAREHRAAQAREVLAGDDASRPTCSTPSAAGPAAGVRVELCRGDELRRRAARPTTTGASRARRRARARARYRLVFHPPSPFFRRVELEVELDDGPLPRPAARLARTRARATAAADRRASSPSSSRAARASSSGSPSVEDPLGSAPRRRSPSCPTTEKNEVLDAHPAIGARSGLSARSAAEQGADDDPAVLAELAELNRAYEEKFGFRFVVFVNRRPEGARSSPVLRARLERTREEELETALDELVAIAEDRWRDVVVDPYATTGGLARPRLPLAARDRRRSSGSARRSTSSRSTTTSSRPRSADASAASAASRGRSTAAASTASRSSASRRRGCPKPLHWFKWEAYTTWLSGLRAARRRLLLATRRRT